MGMSGIKRNGSREKRTVEVTKDAIFVVKMEWHQS